MAYSDKSFFLTKIAQQDYDNLTGLNDANLTSAVMNADSLIDSYLGSITATPLAIVPPAIQQASYDIAVFYLHDRIQFNEIPQRVKDKYDAVINWLKDIASGKANIPGIDPTTVSGTINYECEGGNIMYRGTI